ncbi:asparagine synthetase [glutamine-hydrolyzing] 1 [Candidatus Moduliflexus flocculans]|uniref:asparagine synthase (glutamine-hydrolyzing) n=1 Tax=Candidatus Moduliflexus flocculans TaxID=1499966 RepID=A0A081BNE2_9BACT|nr:asparagine synthetase [glutamine-hydrolyzing] 1 [Candidatus Moduliflexus flocculans]
MCGICGKIYADRLQKITEHEIRRMNTVLQHRGPDDEGYFIKNQIGFGHQRLSIIDLSTGQQPMSNARGDLWIVFNGEIYNFLALRNTLTQQGIRFQTMSDTEIILHLYDLYGVTCVEHLRGMFAFAIWDERQQRLFAARDRVGKKPFFYYVNKHGFWFASEIKAILQDDTVERAMNIEAMWHYLTYQYTPPPATMFQGICQLPPAHTLIYESGEVQVERYWTLRYLPKTRQSSQERQEKLLALLRESVKFRMISDVPIGAFLSGGIDSSLIVALMSECSGRPVQTFSIGFEEEEFNELPYARMVAERYGTDHHEFMVKPDTVEILPKLVWQFDEPFGDSSAIPTYYLAQMTSQYVKVALNGDGGDESFAGYMRYLGMRFVKYYRWLPHPIRRNMIEAVLRYAHPHLSVLPAPLAKLFRYLRYVNDLSLASATELYAYAMMICDNSLKTEIVTPNVLQQVGHLQSFDFLASYFHGDHTNHQTDAMLYTDVMTYLPGDLLVKMDRMTMAHHVEGRSPFLDHKLMEFIATVPAEEKIRGSCLKFLLKQVARPYLPEELLTRRKQGFSVPLRLWFRNELKSMLNDHLRSSLLVRDGILNGQTIQRILDEHQQHTQDHQHQIWLLLNLELWYQMFFHHG